MSDPSDPNNIPRVRGYRPSTMPCIGVPGRVYQKIRAASKRMGLPLSAVVYMACREEIKHGADQMKPADYQELTGPHPFRHKPPGVTWPNGPRAETCADCGTDPRNIIHRGYALIVACETVAAVTVHAREVTVTVHAREVTANDPIREGGHSDDVRTLCGMRLGWDILSPLSDVRCRDCLAKIRERTGGGT